MNLICQHCKTKLNIPDHKIPRDKEASFKCPKCQGRIQIPVENKPAAAPEKNSQPAPLSYGERQNALVCVDSEEMKKNVAEVIRQMGLEVEVASDTKAALNKMAYHIYHLIVIDDGFDRNKGLSVFIDRMNAMDMSLRRRICLVFVSSAFNTDDNMAALNTSVNNIINRDDMPHLASFLARAMTEHRNLYLVYNESMKQTGKA